MKLFNIYFIFFKFSGEQPSTSCSINEIQCETGECVPALARCNNVQECQDGSDERGCGNTREYFDDITGKAESLDQRTISNQLYRAISSLIFFAKANS